MGPDQLLRSAQRQADPNGDPTQEDLRRAVSVARYHQGLQDFAVTFRSLQEYRHQADYSPRADFAQDQVSAIIDRAASAMAAFNAAPQDERRRFIVYLALRRR